jgi:hypothetical protein
MEILFKGFHADENGTETVTINGKTIKGNWEEGYYVKSIRKSGFVDNPTIKEIHQIWYDKKDENGFINEQVYSEVIPETVSQFTQYIDIKNNKVFLNNLLQDSEGNIGQVIFERCCFYVKFIKVTNKLNPNFRFPLFDFLAYRDGTVIGNRFNTGEVKE